MFKKFAALSLIFIPNDLYKLFYLKNFYKNIVLKSTCKSHKPCKIFVKLY